MFLKPDLGARSYIHLNTYWGPSVRRRTRPLTWICEQERQKIHFSWSFHSRSTCQLLLPRNRLAPNLSGINNHHLSYRLRHCVRPLTGLSGTVLQFHVVSVVPWPYSTRDRTAAFPCLVPGGGRGASVHLGVTRAPTWWSSLAHGEAQGSRREGSKKPSASFEVSYGLASDVTERHFYHILLVTGQPRGQPDSTLYKACGRGNMIVSIFAKIPSATEEREKANDKQ